MKRRLMLVLTLALVAGLGAGPPASAQDALRLASLRVGLWPEYDQPALLVIYWGVLPGATAFPATISLRMPARIVAPHVVAAQPGPGASLDEVDFQSTEAGEWRVITFQTFGPNFQFEYYDSLQMEGVTRSASYTWPGDYAVDQFFVELQHPPHAEELTTDPSLPTSQVQPSDGLLYHGGEFGSLAAGETFTLQLRYTRSDNAMTVDLLNALQQQSPTADPFTGTQAGTSDKGVDILLLALVAVGSFLLGAAAMRIAINIQASRSRR